MPATTCQKDLVAILTCETGGRLITREIREGDNLIIGSDPDSDVSLDDSEVGPVHCVVSAQGKSVSVRDCYSNSGTYVNGQRVHEAAVLSAVEVRLGNSALTIQIANSENDAPPTTDRATASELTAQQMADLQTAGREPAPPESSEPEVDATVDHAPMSDRNSGSVEGTSHNEPEEATTEANSDRRAADVDDLRIQLHQANTEIEILTRRLEEVTSRSSAGSRTAASDPYQQEMIELLQAEVLDLQAALAERDSASCSPNESSAAPQDALSQSESEKLVSRLEQLLDELKIRDEQVETLTGLLEAAEGAGAAARDEREQITSWLDDIEARFGSREQEWRAQQENLRAQLTTVSEERDRAEATVGSSSSSAKLEAAQKMVTDLRDVASQQRNELEQKDRTIRQLQRDLEEARQNQSREEQMQLAEERAKLARQRQELESDRIKLTKQNNGETTAHMQVLREHLKDVYQQEQKRKEENKLSSRIARLWKRMDGE